MVHWPVSWPQVSGLEALEDSRRAVFKALVFRISAWLSSAFRLLDRLSRRRLAACLIAAAVPMAIRIAAIGKAPIPEPAWDDEYSYLVGADTFVSGRLTNPPHPMWQHCETFHNHWLPTYC